MKLISGLGNPTRKYRNTRHNVGFLAIDRIAADLSIKLKKNTRFSSFLGEGVSDGENVILQKPLTFVNLSGEAVSSAARMEGLGPGDILVICDDVNLDLGRIRIRPAGSAGGHNGLKSVIERLGSDQFHRLRIGVGPNRASEGGLSEYVLDKFSKDETDCLDKVLDAASSAIALYLKEGIDSAMNKYNSMTIDKKEG